MIPQETKSICKISGGEKNPSKDRMTHRGVFFADTTMTHIWTGLLGSNKSLLCHVVYCSEKAPYAEPCAK